MGSTPFALILSGHHEKRSFSDCVCQRFSLFLHSQKLIEAAGMRIRPHLSVAEPKVET